MKLELSESGDLICPSCVVTPPAETSVLELHRLSSGEGETEQGNDVQEGYLACARCHRRFPIEGGVAVFNGISITANGDLGSGRYGNTGIARAYVQNHFRDAILADPIARAAVLAADLTGFYETGIGTDYYRELAGLVAPFLSAQARVLDLGCAVGRLTHELARQARFVIGADQAGLMIRVARQIAAEGCIHFRPGEATTSGDFAGSPELAVDVSAVLRPNVEFVVADDSSLPFRSFDAIVCSAVIDRVKDPPAFLQHLRRVVRDGTILVISSPFDQDDRFVPRDRWLGFGASAGGQGRAEEALERIARRLKLRLLESHELRWATLKDRRNHFSWGVYCGVFEVWHEKIRVRSAGSPVGNSLAIAYRRVFSESPAYRERFEDCEIERTFGKLALGLVAEREASGETVGFVGGSSGRDSKDDLKGAWRALGDKADLDRIFYINELGVVGDFEGAGLGRSLLRTLLGTARANGYHTFMLATSPSNERSMELYRRHGFSMLFDEAGRTAMRVEQLRTSGLEKADSRPYLRLTDDFSCCKLAGGAQVYIHFLPVRDLGEGLEPIAECLSKLFPRAFGSGRSWPVDRVRPQVAAVDFITLVFDAERRPIAYGLFTTCTWEKRDVLYINAIGVATGSGEETGWQGCGLSTHILEATLARTASDVVAGRTQNPAIARLLRKLGPRWLPPLSEEFGPEQQGLLEVLAREVPQLAEGSLDRRTGFCRNAYLNRLNDDPVDLANGFGDAFETRVRALAPEWNRDNGDAILLAAIDIGSTEPSQWPDLEPSVGQEHT